MAKIVVILMISFCSTLGFAQGVTANSLNCRSDLNFPSSVFQTAFNNLQGFAYVNHALQSVKDNVTNPTYCLSSFALSKNDYQYFRFFIQLDIYSKYAPGPTRSFRFLMQDASTQAFQNTGGQPWVALPKSGVDSLFDQVLATADFKPVTAPTIGLTALQAAMQSRTWQSNVSNMDTSTVSIFRIVTSNYGVFDHDVYLVTWMTKAGNNPYTTPVASMGLLLTQNNTSQWLYSENLSVFNDILMPLDNLLQKSVPTAHDVDSWTTELLRISLP